MTESASPELQQFDASADQFVQARLVDASREQHCFDGLLDAGPNVKLRADFCREMLTQMDLICPTDHGRSESALDGHHIIGWSW
jgi:hypothetical protein